VVLRKNLKLDLTQSLKISVQRMSAALFILDLLNNCRKDEKTDLLLCYAEEKKSQWFEMT